ncbi:MAG TPA: flagellar biogenesis protein [Clostridiales bacterium]|nr:MAG: flagellar biogenesis protein [Clostridiales bacterium GWD2_32_19]HCC07555.1 flagellar biogenesis protein [Clostridiales bacterium]
MKKAAAISYNKNEVAPKVVAKGQGFVAENILKKSVENDIPIVKDEKMMKMIDNMDIGDYIPEELYEVVAEVLAFVVKLDEK